MQLIYGWQNILKRAWSIRLILLAGLFSGLETALPYTGLDSYIPAKLFALLSLVISAAAVVSRIVAQPRMHNGTENS